MPVKMAPHQLAFWRELLAPFHDSQLSKTKRGGKELTYVDKRAITNRLDSVVGPHGWYPEYEATNRGYKCRLYISVPTGRDTGDHEQDFVFIHKEDGAGFEEMGSTNKATGEFEYDVDNDEKSGYTNAFRRAAQDAWGIGRYLYGKGIPTFLDPNATAGVAATLPPVQTGPSPSAPPSDLADHKAPPRDTRTPAPNTTTSTTTQYDNFKIPPTGKSVFAWTKEMERAFETTLFDGMAREGEKQGWGRQFGNWDQVQVNTIALGVIKFVRELPSYKGQFEYMFPGGVADPKIPTAQGSGPNTPPTTPGVNVADLRKELMTKMQALFSKQTGSAPDTAQLKAVFGVVASTAKNGQGHAGECPESLSKLTDVVWVQNMIALVDAQIAEAVAPAEQGDPSIPF